MVETDLSEIEAAEVEPAINDTSKFEDVIREDGARSFAKGLIEFAEWAEESSDGDAPDWIAGE